MRLVSPVLLALLLAACSREPAYRSVSDFVDDPALLEAALVRCTENRSESRYEAECVGTAAAFQGGTACGA